MTEFEDFIVTEPYQPTKEEKKAIEELEKIGLEPKDWDSGRKYIKSFKENLRKDMYIKQNRLCAYCRVHVPISNVPLHREHIVYKDRHLQWMFLPENLCVSCPTCNENKGTKEVLENPNTKSYPTDGAGFKIIHPLYDKYSDYIELVDGILYRGKKAKGFFTIETCKLNRVSLAEERVYQMMMQNQDGSIVTRIVLLAAQASGLVDDVDSFRNSVERIVKNFKESNNV